MPTTSTSTSLAGRTLRWTIDDGPTAGSTYEHTFAEDGSVVFRKVEAGTASGKGTQVKKYAAFEVAPEVQLLSYLAGDSGYTLTVALNFDSGRLYGFASNDKEWYPVSGTFEALK